jgi:hypothetical protein
MFCILLAGVTADRYFLAPGAWAPAAVPQQPVAPALPQTYEWAESSSVPALPGFMPTWAALDSQRAVVEMRSRINMKKEKRKRNRLNMLRYKKPDARSRWGQQRNRGGPDAAAADADAKFMTMVFTETDAAAASAAAAVAQ